MKIVRSRVKFKLNYFSKLHELQANFVFYHTAT